MIVAENSLTVAALYVDPRGPYPKMAGVDWWDEKRDATKYDGALPVVAHPPCGPWGRLKHLYLGSEHHCAPKAVAQVRDRGGVLEHPAGSLLFGSLRLPLPGETTDQWGGYTVEVDQVEWGHCARKRTWLYLVGVPRSAVELPPLAGRSPTHWVSGFRSTTRPKTYDRSGSAVPAGIKVCSAQQRRRTPPLFAEYLVRLALASRRP